MSRSFGNLPNEIILLIGDHLTARDLHSLVRASRHFSALFLSRLRDFALKEENTYAAIFCAAASGNRVMLKRVLEKGENVILSTGSTVVYRSPGVCSEWILAWILNGRPNMFLGKSGLGKRPRTAISWAVWTSHQALLRLLLDKGKIKSHSVLPALTAVLRHGNVKAAKPLLDRMLSEDLEPQKSCSKLLRIATSNNHINMVKLLLDGGADINATERFGSRREPLFRIAEEKGHIELARLLVERHIRADANFIDLIGKRSAIYLAVQFSSEALVRHVLEKGAFLNTNLQDPWGNTPFQLAAQKGNEEIIKLLACHSGTKYCKIFPCTIKLRCPSRKQTKSIKTVDEGHLEINKIENPGKI